MAERPGTMIYFDDLLPLFDVLHDADVGQLFKAIVRYGKYGEVPDFSKSPTLAIAWGFIRPKIDRDGEKYEQEINQRRYAVYCREIRKSGSEPVSFNDWYRELSADASRHPTGTASASESETEPEAVYGAPSTTAAGRGYEGGITGGGEGEPPPPPPPPGEMDWKDYERIRKSWRSG